MVVMTKMEVEDLASFLRNLKPSWIDQKGLGNFVSNSGIQDRGGGGGEYSLILNA